MLPERLKKVLRFLYIIDGKVPNDSVRQQTETAILAGATLIRYPSGAFSIEHFETLLSIQKLCRSNDVLLLIDNDPILAKAIGADGVHIADVSIHPPAVIKKIVGDNALIGISFPFLGVPSGDIRQLVDYFTIPGALLPLRGVQPTKEISKRVNQLISKLEIPAIVVLDEDYSSIEPFFLWGASGVAIDAKKLRNANTLKSHITEIGKVLVPGRPKALSHPWKDEFALIARLIGSVTSSALYQGALKIPPGDDAALLYDLSKPVITTDTHREGVHFQFLWQTPEEIGRKAVSVTLSDLAASYATPVALFINLSLPANLSEETIIGFYRGVDQALFEYRCALGGGNISRGESVALDLFAIGNGFSEIFPTRASARPGYGLFITGPIGSARAGLEALKRKDGGFPGLIRCFKAPKARFDAAKILADNGVKCVIDISDGLAGDALHIAKSSNITIEIDLSAFKAGKELLSFCRKYHLEPLHLAVGGGEDYELLFACPLLTFSRIHQFLPDAYCVGRCLDFQGEYILGDTAQMTSFQHG